jgi:hypothetical protein
MKTVKDLKIGDKIYELYGTTLTEKYVTRLVGQKAVYYGNNDSSKEQRWEDIKDATYFEGTYSAQILYCNQSEAIMAVKEAIRVRIDEQMKEIAKECDKLIELKEQMFKYL